METIPGVQVSAAELRVRVYDYQNYFSAVVQSAADAIIDQERDLGIQEAAIRWKVNAIPAMEKAVFQTDPLAAFGDAWVLTLAMARYFDEGEGKGLFGSSQTLATDAARRLASEMDASARALLGTNAAAARQEFEEWIRVNPIIDLSFGRRSAMTKDSAVTAAGLRASGLQAVGQIEATARDLSERLTVYFERLPKQIRWNAELVVIEVMRELGYQLFEDIGSIEESAKGIRSFVDQTPALLSSEREAVLRAVRQDLNSTLQSVDRQRVETLDRLLAEREIILETLQIEVEKSLSAVRQERIEALAKLEELSQRTLETSAQTADRLIDRMFWRALVLILIGFALFFIAWILVRVAGRRTVVHRSD
jgi:hypothetical protein